MCDTSKDVYMEDNMQVWPFKSQMVDGTKRRKLASAARLTDICTVTLIPLLRVFQILRIISVSTTASTPILTTSVIVCVCVLVTWAYAETIAIGVTSAPVSSPTCSFADYPGPFKAMYRLVYIYIYVYGGTMENQVEKKMDINWKLGM